ISLPELTWLGWENWGLRALSAGCYTSVVFARSVREGQCMDIFQRELRSRHIDIESAAIQWAQHENQLSEKSAGSLSREDKNDAIIKFVKWIVDQVQKWSVSAVEESQTARIRHLEAQIAELKSQPHRGQTSEREASKRKEFSGESSVPANKRLRVAGKKGLEQTGDFHVTEDQLFELDPPKKPLRADCPAKAGTSSVTSRLKKLPSEVQSQALADYRAIEPLVKTWSDDKSGSVKEIASAWGLPVQLSVGMSNKDLVRVIVAAHHMAKCFGSVECPPKRIEEVAFLSRAVGPDWFHRKSFFEYVSVQSTQSFGRGSEVSTSRFVVASLRDVRCKFQNVLLPFHLEGSHQSVGKMLFSFKEWFNKFESLPGESFCKCKEVLSQHPELETVGGHVASPAERLSMSSHLKKLVGYSAKATIFPSKHVLTARIPHAFVFLKKQKDYQAARLWPNLHGYLREVVIPWRDAVELVFLQYFQNRACNHPDAFMFTVHDRQKFSE
ncbi:unnamed protein product, partial [Symbiodinium necroappetens]